MSWLEFVGLRLQGRRGLEFRLGKVQKFEIRKFCGAFVFQALMMCFCFGFGSFMV